MADRLNNKAVAIRDLINHRLKSVAELELREQSTEAHLDEDAIAAYIEGRLAEAECQPVLAHLAACGLCRRVSAQFVRLDNQIDAEPIGEPTAEDPGRLGTLLSRLGSIGTSNEDVVFAYQNPSEDSSDESKASSSESTDKPNGN